MPFNCFKSIDLSIVNYILISYPLFNDHTVKHYKVLHILHTKEQSCDLPNACRSMLVDLLYDCSGYLKVQRKYPNVMTIEVNIFLISMNYFWYFCS